MLFRGFVGITLLSVIVTGGRNANAQGAPVAQLSIEAGDFFFRAPRRVAAGWTTIRLRNLGSSFHHAVLLRLQPGESRAAALARVNARKGDPDLPIPGTTSIGGPEGRMPSGDSYATVDLAAGEYLIVCTIPTSDGSPHAAHGMFASLTVRPATVRSGARQPPTPDVVIRMGDYAYSLSDNRLEAGWRTLRIENTGPAEHIAELAILKSHKTLAGVLTWANSGFPRATEPMTTIGGSTRLALGQSSYVHVRLTSGRYVIFCMLHDQADRQHLKLGMLKEIVVN